MTTQLEYQLQLSQKQFLMDRNGSKCDQCKSILPEYKLTVDHMLPRSERGSCKIENLQLLCVPCHHYKSHYENLLRNIPIFAFGLSKKKKYGRIKDDEEVIGRKIRRLMKRRYRKFMRSRMK